MIFSRIGRVFRVRPENRRTVNRERSQFIHQFEKIMPTILDRSNKVAISFHILAKSGPRIKFL